ncbi:hypothetical protein CBR_g3198 [Chara braunii]|uniref:GIY-YIG domain-containing protein n=1 Tax=Chara braunii TaxID=69332 RepID=A0A388KF70_CHABU|nr:hypothetical protein CBR_g3198 [Chara braunii]|eukprot:GBG68657.1 hypothetical protein CBR_g3198 [Chara braunii]
MYGRGRKGGGRRGRWSNCGRYWSNMNPSGNSNQLGSGGQYPGGMPAQQTGLPQQHQAPAVAHVSMNGGQAPAMVTPGVGPAMSGAYNPPPWGMPMWPGPWHAPGQWGMPPACMPSASMPPVVMQTNMQPAQLPLPPPPPPPPLSLPTQLQVPSNDARPANAGGKGPSANAFPGPGNRAYFTKEYMDILEDIKSNKVLEDARKRLASGRRGNIRIPENTVESCISEEMCKQREVQYFHKEMGAWELARINLQEYVDSLHADPPSEKGEPSGRNVGSSRGVNAAVAEVYVGKTTRTLKERWGEHLRVVKGNNKQHVHVWLRKTGMEHYAPIPIWFGDAPAIDGMESKSSHNPGLNMIGRKKKQKPRLCRTRKRGADRAPPNVVYEPLFFYCPAVAMRQEPDLLKILKALAKQKVKGTKLVCNNSGARWLKAWRLVQLLFGFTKIEKQGVRMLLKDARATIESGGSWSIVGLFHTKTKTELLKAERTALLRAPWKHRDLFLLSLVELIDLNNGVKSINQCRGRQIVRGILTNVFKKKFGINPCLNIVIKIPFCTTINKCNVERVVKSWILERIRPITLVELYARVWLKARLKVRTVGDILHNQKSFSQMESFDCSCAGFDLPKMNGHVAVKLSEIDHVKSFLFNTKNVSFPGIFMTKDALGKSCNEAVEVLTQSLGISEYVKIDWRDVCRPGVGMTEGCVRSEYVCGVAQAFKGLVMSSLDRNTSETWLVCPKL